MTTETMPRRELSKSYDPANIEPEVLRVWQDENLGHAEPTDPGRPFCIVIPPPNVTGALHLGHALNNTLQDVLIRWRRMAGDNAVWIPGTDHAGIATQTVVEKRVLAEEGKRRTEFQRDEFVAKIQTWKDEYEQRITDQLKRMGCSCDWQRQAFTMDEPRARAVREAFFQLFKAGVIYRGKRLVNWDPATQTALADDEVEMEEIDGFFYYLRYPIVDDDAEQAHGSAAGFEQKYVTVATTRPETMLGDTAVGINPKDPRAASLRGKKIRLPIVNRIVPIIEDDYVVMPDPDSEDPKAKFATGFLKVTPAHDPNDYVLGLLHNLPMINVLGPDGTISDQHGWTDVGGAEEFLGLDRYEAREAAVEWFRRNGLLEDVKPYRHSVGHSYRSHVAIEPYLSDQWYMKVTDDRLRGAALRVLSASTSDDATEEGNDSEGGMGVTPMQTRPQPPAHGPDAHATLKSQLRFFPARYAKTYQAWLENIRDWCISRQLWWGHRIPVWRLPEGRLADRLSEGEFSSVLHKLNQWSVEGRIALTHRGEHAAARAEDMADRTLPFAFACVRNPDDRTVIDELECWGAAQDPDVLDTWFSSGLWPMSTLSWPEETAELRAWNPTHTLSTGRDIITLWVSRMVMFNLFFRNQLPFYEVFIHPTVLDGEGRRMSKSLGNGVDPLDIIHSHGADAMRFTLAQMATNTQDLRMPVTRDAATGKNTSPKFDVGRNFCNKLWNAARFVLMSIENVAPEPVEELRWSMADRLIVSRFNRTVEEANAALRSYRFDQYAKACYDFFWRDFCDWYVEASKPAMRDPKRAGQVANILATTLDGALRLMHPMIPYITEILWWRLNEVRPERGLPGRIEAASSKRLIRAPWPGVGDFAQAAEHIWPKVQEIVTVIRNLRNEHKVDPRKPVSVSIRSQSSDAAMQVRNHKVEIELLATCGLKEIGPDVAAPANSAKTQAAGCEVYIEDLVDTAAEQQRVAKRREEVIKQIAQLEARMSNAGYLAKAPPNLVQQTKDQLAALKAELAKLG